MWVIIAMVLLIVLLAYYWMHSEGMDGDEAPAVTDVAIGMLAFPAHNSGKPSMWVPDGMGPAYHSRRLYML